MLLELLKITCCDCISQPLHVRVKTHPAPPACPDTPVGTRVPSAPQRHPTLPERAPKAMGVGTFSSRAQWVTAQAGRGWAGTQVLHYINKTFSRRCCRRQKGERAKIMNKNSTGTPLAHMPHNLYWPYSSVKLQPHGFPG